MASVTVKHAGSYARQVGNFATVELAQEWANSADGILDSVEVNDNDTSSYSSYGTDQTPEQVADSINKYLRKERIEALMMVEKRKMQDALNYMITEANSNDETIAFAKVMRRAHDRLANMTTEHKLNGGSAYTLDINLFSDHYQK